MTDNAKPAASILDRATSLSWRTTTPLAVAIISCLALAASALVAHRPSPSAAPMMKAAAVEVSPRLTPEGVVEADVVVGGHKVDASVGNSAEVSVDEVELHCPGEILWKFDPGLTEDVQDVTVTGEVRMGSDMDPRTPCRSETGVPYQGGTIDFKGSGQASCTASGPAVDLQGTGNEIFWDTGDVSKVRWSVVSYGAAPVFDYAVTEHESSYVDLTGAEVFQQGTPLGDFCRDEPLTNASYTGVAHFIKSAG